MDLAYYYELWRGMMLSADPAVADAVAWWQEFYVKFYMAFIEADRWKQYLDGIGTTLTATALALVLGVVLGILVALVRTAHDQQRADRRRNPVLGLFNGVCNFTQIGILGLGINSGAYVAEIIRGGLMAVDGGQMEAGRSLGLNYFDTMRFIVIPQAIKAILPALGNEFIILLKDTSLITVIGGKELLHAAQGIMGRTYEAMFPLIGIACMYLVLVMIFTWLLGKLERRLRQSDRR